MGWQGLFHYPEDFAPFSDLRYDLHFPSGVVHEFGLPLITGWGRISRVRDGDGLSASVASGRSEPWFAPGPAAGTLTSPRVYDVTPHWAGGRIDRVDYRTKGSDPETISAEIGYAGDSAAITSLTKKHGGEAVGPFSYALGEDRATLTHAGTHTTRTGSDAGGRVEMTVTADGIPGFVREAVDYNGDGLPTADTFTLNDGATATSATTTYRYLQDEPGRFDNGAPKWAKVELVTGPDGAWEKFAFDPATGWVNKSISPFKNSAPTEGDASHVVRAYGYARTTAADDATDPSPGWRSARGPS